MIARLRPIVVGVCGQPQNFDEQPCPLWVLTQCGQLVQLRLSTGGAVLYVVVPTWEPTYVCGT